MEGAVFAAPNIAMKVDKMETGKEMVLNGLGYAILPTIVLGGQEDLYKINLTTQHGEPWKRKSWMIYRKESLNLTLIKEFVDFMKNRDLETPKKIERDHRGLYLLLFAYCSIVLGHRRHRPGSLEWSDLILAALEVIQAAPVGGGPKLKAIAEPTQQSEMNAKTLKLPNSSSSKLISIGPSTLENLPSRTLAHSPFRESMSDTFQTYRCKGWRNRFARLDSRESRTR